MKPTSYLQTQQLIKSPPTHTHTHRLMALLLWFFFYVPICKLQTGRTTQAALGCYSSGFLCRSFCNHGPPSFAFYVTLRTVCLTVVTALFCKQSFVCVTLPASRYPASTRKEWESCFPSLCTFHRAVIVVVLKQSSEILHYQSANKFI